MNTLLLRLASPLQSWGVDAKFDRRVTERSPTKSGVIGLVASALGRKRDESIADLLALRFGVRVDREGTLLCDYHTAQSEKSAYVTKRYYLSDAVFLAGLEGHETLLEEIDYALRRPVFPLFLGRRSCPPEGKLALGIRFGKTVYQALREEPSQATDWLPGREAPEVHLSIITDADASDKNTFFQRDIPLSFDQTHRKFGFRCVAWHNPVTLANSDSRRAFADIPTQHDPMLELEE